MSEATTTRGPDILTRSAPSLSATTDSPTAPPEAPPVSASNNPADLDAGIPTEMSPEAQAAAARRTRADAAPDAAPAKTDAAKDTPADNDNQQKPAETTPDPEIDSIKVDGKEVPLPPWMKREITKARNRQREAEAKARDIEAKANASADELAALRAKVEELTAKFANDNQANDNTAPASDDEPGDDNAGERAPQPTDTKDATAADPRPTRDQFDDPDEYDEALTAWGKREGEREALAKLKAETEAAEADTKQKAQEAELARINAEWMTRKTEAISKYPDFEAVTTADDLPISQAMAEVIITDPNGPEVAYYLGKNPEEAARIANLGSPVRQAVEIARLSERLTAPEAPAQRVTRAPRPQPIEPVSSSVSAADASDREPTMEEVYMRSQKQYAASRKPFIATS